MSKETTYISIGDFLDVYHKIRERGFSKILSKFQILPSSRIKSKWNSFESSSDFWLIPEIQQDWNKSISGDENMIYEDYVVKKYFSNMNNLSMLSIGCGEGNHDRNFIKYNCFSNADAIDYSPESIENAKKKAKENNLSINYFQGDFKKQNFQKEAYDLILFSSSLHHFEEVDTTLKEYVKPLLKKDGILVIMEYAGPNRLQWRNNQLEKANEILKDLPEKYKLLYDKKSLKKKVYRPGIFRMLLVDPSEAVDSESIIPALKNNFEIIEQTNLGWNILHILLKGIAQNFINEEKETKILLEKLIRQEKEFVKKEGKSDAIFGVYKKK